MAGAGVEYLSRDALDRIVYHTQAWGLLGIGTCAHAPGIEPLPIRIAGKAYTEGLGHHASGEILIALDGAYSRFQAEVGVQDQGQSVGSVVFQVFVDGRKRADTGVRRDGDPPLGIDVDVEGVMELRLLASDAGDGITCDCADWADARLIRSHAPAHPPHREPVDIAPFADVVTCDPRRVDGARAGRIEEFRAEDVWLELPVRPRPDGAYEPPATGGLRCIGLRWVERRLLRDVSLEFAGAGTLPPPDTARLEVWLGESWWQGSWQKVEAPIRAEGRAWAVSLGRMAAGGASPGYWKVRWIWPATKAASAAVRLHATTQSVWETTELRIESTRAEAADIATMEVYNGYIVDGDSATRTRMDWPAGTTRMVRVRYSRPWTVKADRTVLRFRFPQGGFGVAVEDVLAAGRVWVPAYGVSVALGSESETLHEYAARHRESSTVLSRVRAMPDQTREGAFASTHDAQQNHGPTMLSLASANEKFVALEDGAVEFRPGREPSDPELPPDQVAELTCEVRPRIGEGGLSGERRLDGGWLPVEHATWRDGPVTYDQRTFVAPAEPWPARPGPVWTGRSVCVADFSIANAASAAHAPPFSLRFVGERSSGALAEVAPAGTSAFTVAHGERLLAVVRVAGLRGKVTAPGTLALAEPVGPGATARVTVLIPNWAATLEECAALPDADELSRRTRGYWEAVLADAASIDLPDALLTNVIRASQVHCLIAARNEAGGARIAPWIASMAYGPLESEAHSVVRGMDLLGHHEFARRGLDYFITRYNPKGYLTTGYTLIGTGWHLWALGEHVARAHDTDWLRPRAPEVARLLSWIVAQRKKTMHVHSPGDPCPEYGLMPPGVVADWNVYGYRLYLEANYCAGLREGAEALSEVSYPGAQGYVGQAKQFTRELTRAYRWLEARTPVVALQDGTWVPWASGMLGAWGPTADAFPGEDGNRSWASDVEIGGHHLVAMGIMRPDAPETPRMMDALEDRWFLMSGWGWYPETENQVDWFGRGGFAKVQPYYGRTTDVYALRDDVKPFIRAYFNSLASLLNLENLSLWEHFHNMGAWNKTHETGTFLTQTRTMLATERGDALWLAPFLPSAWTRDGEKIAVAGLPTKWGPASYTIESHASAGAIRARVTPPATQPPGGTWLRVRHPEGKAIRSVTVNDRPWTDFDPPRECVHLPPMKGTIELECRY